ncbi:hypothetical protein FG386_002035 [Cryptosporidium ryanae]|uniref:uncharacterized protein n=1 Tax=Cryptosporidium ryanae TaxID=515981 RepID=UPI00351A4705|nr:hypothetical protein FG386_002035 [Cryptosporidium ryanae]
MHNSKTITDQLEELIKRAKSLKVNKHVSIVAEEDNENKDVHKVTDLYSLELKLLDKRLEMCTIQKNAIKELIKTHKEELELLESALRSISEEEKKIQGVIIKESSENDVFSRATSMELIENDNHPVLDNINSSSNNNEDSSLYNEEIDSSNSYENDLTTKKYFFENQSECSEGENSKYSNSYYSKKSNNFDRQVRFSVNDLKHKELEYNKNQSIKNRNLTKTTISIPRRYNYIRNKNSSLLKDISIKKILDGGRKLNLDERDVEQRELVRQLHNIYGSRK